MSAMSTSFNRNCTRSTAPFCKFCYDAGRGDFDSHSTRDKMGKLTCKFLASISCTRCGENGHTLKYCRAKMSNGPVRKAGEWSTVTKRRGEVGVGLSGHSSLHVPLPASIGGGFSALIIDDDVADVPYATDIESRGTLCVDVHAPEHHSQLIGDDGSKVTITWASKSNAFEPVTKKTQAVAEAVPTQKLSWADMVDEEGDDEPLWLRKATRDLVQVV